ncbi:glycosyltransferase family 2 protein [Candidatus Colwellia aromaticivorans]|uniref:glycosyltransferase family 2 protein n=1 Tax=Candidatus Colwellia aromaticivorans TaxID=2267621 RepID=UPI0014439BE5|nr:glycosyltransferase family 2 protein [Candidatus Colwellia aromaticivorans]
MCKLSIVTTLYSSEKYINEFYERIVISLSDITNEYEIVFVNDGSPDESLKKAREIAKKDQRVRVVNLSRNFGHHNAIVAGLESAEGELVFLIDVDLEEDPELIETFWREYNNDPDVDVVYGIAKQREGSKFRMFAGSLFYRLFNHLSNTQIPHNLMTVRLMSRQYIEALSLYEENSVFLGGLFADVGFNQRGLVVEREYKGESTYTLRKRINLLVNAITAFSSKPLEMFVYIGSTVSAISFLAILFVIFKKIFLSIDVAGWASAMIMTSFFGGIQILSIGVIGTYLGKVFNEVKGRPRYIVSDIFKKEKDNQNMDNK